MRVLHNAIGGYCQDGDVRGVGEGPGLPFLEPGVDLFLLESDPQALPPDAGKVSFIFAPVDSLGAHPQVGGNLLDCE